MPDKTEFSDSEAIYLKQKDVARLLGLSTRQIQRLTDEGVFERQKTTSGTKGYELYSTVHGYLGYLATNENAKNSQVRDKELDLKEQKLKAEIALKESQAELHELKTGIEKGADCILVSHNIVNCMDNKYPASLSAAVHKYIRETMKFDGVVITDDLVMEAITQYTGSDSSAVFAVKNGNDMLCCSDLDTQYNAVLKAVKNSEITEEQIDKSVKRILLWKQKLGLIKSE